MKNIFLALLLVVSTISFSQTIDENWVKEHFTKKEFTIAMRDGAKLFTAAYIPKSKAEKLRIKRL